MIVCLFNGALVKRQIFYFSAKYHCRIVLLIRNSSLKECKCERQKRDTHTRKPFNIRFITVNTDKVQVYTHSSPQHWPSSALILRAEDDRHWPLATGSNTSWPLEGNKGSDKWLDGCKDEHSDLSVFLYFIMVWLGLFIGIEMSGPCDQLNLLIF